MPQEVVTDDSGNHKSKTAPELVAETLEAVPTIFGRLVWLANMLERHSGQYVHPLPFRILRDAAASALLQQAHERLVICWLESTPEHRVRDLAQFLEGCGQECFGIASNLLQRKNYAELLPLKMPAMNRDHFLLDMEWALPLAVSQLGEEAVLARELGSWPLEKAPAKRARGFVWFRQEAHRRYATLAALTELIIDSRLAQLRHG